MNLTYNKDKTRKVPINRNNLFYSEESFQFDAEMAKSYLETDLNQTIVLYEVDLEKSNLDSTYGETRKDGIVFKTPKELHVVYKIEDPELKAYEKGRNLGNYLLGGKLTFGIMQATLEEMRCDIRIGDYVGVQVENDKMAYYTVVNDGRINYSNTHTNYGYKSAYRSITAVPVDVNEFKGK